MANQKLQVEISGDGSQFLEVLSKLAEKLKVVAEHGVKATDGLNKGMAQGQKETGKLDEATKKLEGSIKGVKARLEELYAQKHAGKPTKELQDEIKKTERELKSLQGELRRVNDVKGPGGESSPFMALANDLGLVSTVAPETGAALGAAAGPIGLIIGSVVALGTGLMALVGISEKAITKSADYADAMGKEAQKAGITAEAYSGLAYAAEQMEIPREALTKGFEKLDKAMFAAAENAKSPAAHAFDVLGVSVRDANGHLKDSDVVFEEVSEKLSRMEDGAKKTALAQQVFGKAGAELIPLLNEGKEGLDAFRKKAEDLGLVISGKDAAAAKEMNEALKDLHKVAEGLWIQFGREAIPIVTDLLKFILELAKEALPAASESGLGLRGVLIDLSLWFKNNVTDVKSVIEALNLLWTAYNDIQDAVLKGDFAMAKDITKTTVARIKEVAEAHHLAIEINEATAAQQRLNASLELPKKKRRRDGDVDSKPEKEQDQEFEQLKAKLEEEREFYENSKAAKGEYVEWTKTQDAAFWKGVLDQEDLSDKTRARAQQEYFKARREELKKSHEEELKLNESFLERGKAEHLAALDAQAAEVAHALATGVLTQQQALREQAKIEEEKFRVEKEFLEARLAVANLEPLERSKINAQVEALEAKHAAAMKKIDYEMELATDRSNQRFLDGLKGTSNAFSGLLTSLVTDSKNASSHISAAFKSLAASVVGALSQMITKTLLYKAVKLLADKQIISSETAKRAATLLGIATDQAATVTTTTKAAADTAATGPTVTQAAAQTFQAHSGIPIVGAIIAAALVALMLVSMSKATGREVGGVAGKNGPELTMLGEKGLEVVAPESDFKDWANGLVLLGTGVGAAIARKQASVAAYGQLADGYARSAAGAQSNQSSGDAVAGGTVIHIEKHVHGHQIGDDRRSLQELGELVQAAHKQVSRANTGRIIPGQPFKSGT